MAASMARNTVKRAKPARIQPLDVYGCVYAAAGMHPFYGRHTCRTCVSLFPRTQLEEDLSDHLKWSMLVSRVLHTGQSPYQTMELLQTPAFGKVR